MRVCLIINPNAGRKTGLAVTRRVSELLTHAGVRVEERVSTEPGGTRAIAAALEPADWDGILAVGGDGTLFEVVNGLLTGRDRVPVPVGVIPVGTGNSFIKDLGMSSPEEAVAPVIARTTRRVDVGRFACDAGEYAFVNLLGAGFVSNVAWRARPYKAFGALSYVVGVIQEVIGLQPAPVRLTLDDRVIEREAIFVEVCNSRYTGGTMMMAPDARLDDGLFDVVVAGAMTRGTVLKLLPRIFSGRHVENPAVEVFRAATVSLESAWPLALTPDGEIFGSTPISARMEPGALEMFAP